MDNQLEKVIETVQHNCHIADARHAGDFTLCVYLLKMREMYRWEQGLDFKTMLTTDDVGDWLTVREGVWDDLEAQDYQPLEIQGKTFDPFHNELINALLDDHRLVYNAGLGVRSRPHFFIAELEDTIYHDDYTIYISNKEYARDMAAPPAMAQEKNIYIRRESLQRVIWEILDDARVQGLDNPLTRAMRFYEFDSDVECALQQMTEAEIKYVIQHEIGEIKAGQLLGEKWNDLLASVAKTQAEIMLRAVRDHLADSMTTLPSLIYDNNPASIHFYFGNMTAMRKHLAPALMDAYEHWHNTGDVQALENAASESNIHWKSVALQASSLQQPEKIEDYIQNNKLGLKLLA